MKRQLSLLFLKGKNVFFITAVNKNIFCCNDSLIYNVTVGGNMGLLLSSFKIWMDVRSRRRNFCIVRELVQSDDCLQQFAYTEIIIIVIISILEALCSGCIHTSSELL